MLVVCCCSGRLGWSVTRAAGGRGRGAGGASELQPRLPIAIKGAQGLTPYARTRRLRLRTVSSWSAERSQARRSRPSVGDGSYLAGRPSFRALEASGSFDRALRGCNGGGGSFSCPPRSRPRSRPVQGAADEQASGAGATSGGRDEDARIVAALRAASALFVFSQRRQVLRPQGSRRRAGPTCSRFCVRTRILTSIPRLNACTLYATSAAQPAAPAFQASEQDAAGERAGGSNVAHTESARSPDDEDGSEKPRPPKPWADAGHMQGPSSSHARRRQAGRHGKRQRRANKRSAPGCRAPRGAPTLGMSTKSGSASGENRCGVPLPPPLMGR